MHRASCAQVRAAAYDVGEANTRTFHLARAGFATQMCGNLVDIRNAGSAEGMAFG